MSVAKTVPDRAPAAPAMKVPATTSLFWAIKILTTGMGETSSDYFVGALKPEIAVILGAIALAACLGVQILAPRYGAWTYWIAVLMVAVFGTMAADVVHVVLGVPYLVSSLVFALTLAAAFAIWQRIEGTLSVHSITTRRREVFYWSVVLLTFALGTALGDLSAHNAGLGYFASAILYGVLILIPLAAFRAGRLGEVAAFWSAYVVTRPLGASLADWMGAPLQRGGLGLGFGRVSLALGVVFVILVAITARREAAAWGPVRG
jgi:uncharacterized membrane-anchored protein